MGELTIHIAAIFLSKLQHKCMICVHVTVAVCGVFDEDISKVLTGKSF